MLRTLSILCLSLFAVACVELDEDPLSEAATQNDEAVLVDLVDDSVAAPHDEGLYVMATAPRAGEVLTPCGVGSYVLVRFNQPTEDLASVVEFGDAEGQAMDVKATLITSEAPWIVKATPAGPLQIKTDYVLTIRGGDDGAHGRDGQPLAEDFVLSFETGDRDVDGNSETCPEP